MDVQRCKNCGCIFVEDEVICPTCGANNRARKMFDGPSSKHFSFMETEFPCHVRKKSMNRMDKRTRRCVLFVLLGMLLGEWNRKNNSKR